METDEEKQNKLTPENERFALIYVDTGDKYKAYEMAGYEAKSKSVQASAVSRMLKNPAIQQRIEELKHEYALAAGVTPERILANLAEIAFDKDNNKSDRNRSLELLGKSRGMWTDVVKTTQDADPLSEERRKELKEQAVGAAQAEKQRLVKLKTVQGGDVV